MNLVELIPSTLMPLGAYLRQCQGVAPVFRLSTRPPVEYQAAVQHEKSIATDPKTDTPRLLEAP